MTLQSQTFLSASQRTPPRSRPEPRTPSINIGQLPTYDYDTTQLAIPAVRQHYEERDHLYDANYFTEV